MSGRNYIVVMRESINHAWTPFPYFQTLVEAQQTLIKTSLYSDYDYDIWYCESVLKRSYGEEKGLVEPEIVKGRGAQSSTAQEGENR